MTKILVAFAVAALLLPEFAHATSDASGQMQVMQSLLDRFAQNGRAWLNATNSVALSVFGTLALIELALKMRKVVLSGGEEGPLRVIGVLINSILTWGFFLWAMKNPEFVLGNIVHGFEKLGGKASGMGTLNPSQMIGAGIDVAIQINNGVSSWTALTSPAVAFTASFTELAVIAGFAILGLQMFACLLHYYLLLACAPILLAGGALSFTRDWAVKQFQGAVATGVKIFVIYLIAGVVTSFVPDFKSALNSGGLDNIAPLLGMLAAGILIMFLGFLAPSVASAIMGGTSSMSANEMAGFGASVGGAAAMGLGMAVGGAQLAGAMMSKGVQGLGGLSNAAGSLGNALGQMSSSGGVMKEALSTGGGGMGGQGGSPIDTAKRVGGDMPTGMTPSTPESKALMNQPAEDPRKAPSTEEGGKGGGESGQGAGKPSDGSSGQSSTSEPAQQQGSSTGANTGSPASGNVGQQSAAPRSAAGASATSGTRSGTPTPASGVSGGTPAMQARASGLEQMSAGSSPTQSAGGVSAGGGTVPQMTEGQGATATMGQTAEGSSASHGSGAASTTGSSEAAQNSAPIAGSTTGGAGASPGTGASPNGTSAVGGAASAQTGSSAGPTAGQGPAGDASNASISGNQNENGADPQKPSRTQKVRDMLDSTHRNFDSAKGFIPDAHNNGSLHINLQE